MKSVHGPKYKCSYQNCKRKYSNERDLKTHMKIHTLSQDKLYKCMQCQKSFQFKSELKTHEKSHSDFREFVCHTCGKEFKHKGMLNRHAEVHSLVSNYFSCPVQGCDVSRNNVDLIMNISDSMVAQSCTCVEHVTKHPNSQMANKDTAANRI